jgi:hypothetical protein
MASSLRRGDFLSATGGAVLLAGCGGGGGGGGSLIAPPQNLSLPDLMQRVGLGAVRDPKTGKIIYATGYTPPVQNPSKPTTAQPLSCDNQPPDSVRRSIKDDCVGDFYPPTSDVSVGFAGDQGTTALYYISTTPPPPPPPAVPQQWWSMQVLPYTSVYGLNGPLASWQFLSPPVTIWKKCGAQILVGVSAAAGMAGAILANASKFPPAVVASARNAMAGWAGTTLGAAAAFEFIGGVIAALTLPEWLTLLSLTGGTALSIYEAYQCYYGIFG